MNSLNNSLVDVGAGTAIDRVERKREVRTDASTAGRVDAGGLGASIAPRLTNKRVVVFS